ncbi:chemotaxis-specific protein-glutamate methyltransferase CheB [Chryseolinea sp. T2]|uniref:chemotaxis-specific protein-glutamate methyltransferase CheB n=1 Tax=Chryseolinea sp. T2 TaxID=3129255 RepID=UPI003077AD6E
MPSRIRTVLIDDSAFMRKLIGDVIRRDNEIELVGIAKNGREGEQLALNLRPDVVVTDVVMSDYDGVYVVNSLMEKQPVPIILLSSLEKTDTRVFDALKGGAFEFVDKPADYRTNELHGERLLSLIKEASRADISHLKSRVTKRANNHQHSIESINYDIVVIGASTGGPAAIEHIVTNLPRNLQVPVVVVQHMPTRFIESFTARLNETNTIPVKLASKGESLKGGNVYVAPGETNILIERNIATGSPIIVFTQRKYREFNYPSIDSVFESASETFGRRAIGVLLTGMGKDGAVGLKKIRESGGYTIAQDEDSSVVYGMPRVASEMGAVRQIVSLNEIPGFIVSCL